MSEDGVEKRENESLDPQITEGIPQTVDDDKSLASQAEKSEEPEFKAVTPDGELSGQTEAQALESSALETESPESGPVVEAARPTQRMDSTVDDTIASELAAVVEIIQAGEKPLTADEAPDDATAEILTKGGTSEEELAESENPSVEETASLGPASDENADASHDYETEYPTVIPGPGEREKSPAPFAGFLAEIGDEGQKSVDAEEASGDLQQSAEEVQEEEDSDQNSIGLAPSRRATVIVSDEQGDAPTGPPVPASSAYQRNRQAQITDELPGRARRNASNVEVRGPMQVENSSGGDLKLGAYRVIGELGSGGMAVIYKAVQTAVDRMVAIKELRPELISDKEVMARFEREATSMASLQHGNIVQIYDFVQDFDSAYIVMEYVEGTDLFDVLAHCQRIPQDVVAIIGFKVASALEYAHYRGIIHRDIKPSNVLMSNQGEIKLLDFGIARDPGRSNITQIGMALGTPAYMSPEQIRGEKIDFRADIFSLGVCLYEFLAGEKPWADDGTQEVARKILIEPPRSLREFCPDVSFEMEKIISQCLAKEADDRFSSTFELTRALQSMVVRDLDINSRQRLVVFLNNRQMVASERAASLVDDETLAHAGLRRRDLGLAQPSGEPLFRKAFIACGAAVALIFVIAFFSVWLPWGEDLASRASAVAINVEQAPAKAKPAATPKATVEKKPVAKELANPKSSVAKPKVASRPKLKRAVVAGNIRITGSKKWYDVYVNGRKLYRHPKRGKPLAPGRYMIQLKNPTCKTIKKRVLVRSRQTTTVKAVCRPNR